MYLTKEELKQINGGLVNALLSLGRSIYNLGKVVGASLRRLLTRTAYLF